MGDALYFAFRAFVRLWIWIFFRRIQVRHSERVPLRGPAVLAMNHPNNLIDTLIIATIIRRKIHYLATASLFEHRLLAVFLRTMGVMPLHRRQDTADPAERNVAAFRTDLRREPSRVGPVRPPLLGRNPGDGPLASGELSQSHPAPDGDVASQGEGAPHR